MTTGIRAIYATALRNARALETQGLEQMQQRLLGLERAPGDRQPPRVTSRFADQSGAEVVQFER